ncbi:ATP-binding protein [Telmatospirillum sp.]|uniref:ATP-binding protein n=1 Tax=Telmatospirillum sp. TaxID=2079197 RepID=UPI00284A15F2|nr:ATP-binding protein [Telmatospirillum sp.]MDR3435130.1 ATP-binding protein [Telmatospirillum sp.]
MTTAPQTEELRGLRRWLSSLQGKLIIASLLISLVPTSIAADLTVRLVTHVVNNDVQSFLHETSVLFLNSFKESQSEAVGLARFLYEQKHGAGDPVVKADNAFLHLAQTLGYGVVVVSDKDHNILYSNYPIRRIEPLSPEVKNTLYALQLPDTNQVMTGGAFTYEANGQSYEILVGTWLDENFIENLQSITTLDLRLYYRRPNGFQMIYSSRSDTASGTPLPSEVTGELEDGVESVYDPQAEEGGYRVLYLPVKNERGDMIGVMSAGLRSSEMPSIWDLPVNILVTVFAAGLSLTTIAGLFVSRRLSKPLRALADGVKSITEGNFDHRVDVTGRDEVAELARVFNHMAERLGQLQSLEVDLRRRDRLSAVGEVAVGIAHEVRNPLGTIKTSAELIRKRDGLAAGDAKLIGYVIDEVRRIDGLIEEFLSFARPREPVLRPLALTQVVARVADFCEPELSRHGIELAVIDDSAGAVVDVDEDHLFQACLNLVLNAVEAMEQGGRLTIRLAQSDDRLRIDFTDTGPGIPKDIADKIFDPFFTTKPHGTGLGLAKVFSVMESHHGRVEIQSQAGHGATFTLILPISKRTMANVAHDPARR